MSGADSVTLSLVNRHMLVNIYFLLLHQQRTQLRTFTNGIDR